MSQKIMLLAAESGNQIESGQEQSKVDPEEQDSPIGEPRLLQPLDPVYDPIGGKIGRDCGEGENQIRHDRSNAEGLDNRI